MSAHPLYLITTETNSQPSCTTLRTSAARAVKNAKVLTMKEHDTKKVQCPKCQSTDWKKIIEPFCQDGQKS
jgi:hypothetical protein